MQAGRLQAHTLSLTHTHTPAVIRTLCKIKSDRSQIESEINCRLCGCPTMYWVKCWLLVLPRLLLLLLPPPLALVKSKSNNNWSQTHWRSWTQQWLESSLMIAFNWRRKTQMHSLFTLETIRYLLKRERTLRTNFRFIYQTHLQCSECPSYHFSCHILGPTTTMVNGPVRIVVFVAVPHSAQISHDHSVSQSLSQCQFVGQSGSLSVA